MFQNTTISGKLNQGFLEFKNSKDAVVWYRLEAKGKVDLSQYENGEAITVSGQVTGSAVTKGTAYMEMDVWFVRRPDEHSADMVIVGRLGRDPELRHTASGSPVCNLSVAVDNSKDDTVWVSVSVWGRQGENAARYLSKGQKVLVVGYPSVDSWKDRQSGESRSKVSLTGRRVVYLSDKKSTAPSREPTQTSEIPF